MAYTFHQTIQTLESYIVPPKKGDTFRLDRIRQLLDVLGNPQNAYKVIHIGGTSGKGSTSHFIAKILEESGYKVGLSISPHLISVRERLTVNSISASESEFSDVFWSMKPAIDTVAKSNPLGAPSYFEIVVALALMYFQRKAVNVAVVEVGMGGRFDATNVIDSTVSVVTNVGLDHTEFLGDTVEKIILEKREIIKPNTRAVSGVTQKSVRTLIEEKCAAMNTPLTLINRDFFVENVHGADAISNPENDPAHIVFDYVSDPLRIQGLELGVSGTYQAVNAAVAITACLCFPGFSGSEGSIRKALFTASIPGRMELMPYGNKSVLLDGAHNPMKIAALVETLSFVYPDKKFPVLFAVKNDKNLSEMLTSLMPHAKRFILSPFYRVTDMGKSVMYPLGELERAIRAVNPTIDIMRTQDLSQALLNFSGADNEQSLLVTGSLYLVGETRKILSIPWKSKQ